MEEGNFKQRYWRRNYDLWSLVHGAERAAEEKKPKSMGSMGTDGAGSEPFFFLPSAIERGKWFGDGAERGEGERGPSSFSQGKETEKIWIVVWLAESF